MAAYLDIVLRITDPEDRSTFIELIEHLDALFLKDYAEKQKAAQQKGKAKRAPRSGR